MLSNSDKHTIEKLSPKVKRIVMSTLSRRSSYYNEDALEILRDIGVTLYSQLMGRSKYITQQSEKIKTILEGEKVPSPTNEEVEFVIGVLLSYPCRTIPALLADKVTFS